MSRVAEASITLRGLADATLTRPNLSASFNAHSPTQL